MDENAYRTAYEAANPLPCSFEKAVLTRLCGCELARIINLAERETVSCRSAAACDDCRELHALLRHNALFTLKLIHEGPLPHAKELKVQCGGLLGLQRVLAIEPADHARVANVFGLVAAGQKKYGSLSELPYSEIVQSIAAYEARRRS
jgi:hypothetical protein